MKSLTTIASTTAVSSIGTLIVGLLLWVTGAFTLIPDWGGHQPAVKAAVLLAAFVIQLTAPRRPAIAVAAMLILIVVDFGSGVSLPIWISFTDVIFAVMTVGSVRLRRTVGAGCFVVTVGGAVAVAVTVDPRAGVLAGLLGVAFLISPLGYAQSVHATVRAARAEQSAAEAEHRTALADERRRVSRELHDTVAGHVSSIAILAEAARDAPDPAPIIASMRANSLAALSELRAMIDVLAGEGDDTATVRWSSLAPLLTAARSVGSDVVVDGGPEQVSVLVETVLTRIAGEAVTNATRHAPGEPITVDVSSDGRTAALTVSNGVAAATQYATNGNGLRNMRIRAESIGGMVTAGRVGAQWVVHAELPVGPR
ncbi:sensor histidine kinase [Gordonia hydrophobica]|uniref:histidine kinase n=1 Tax=Gordonia hydrophobica TaxID=40516 RepID=A0ABZ2TXQ8_9ACTN|nr:histidine kinase [Gordonia hydrophobica]MBM7366417.1 signal transduction histidine kinase [Gordonia hydrophobica]